MKQFNLTGCFALDAKRKILFCGVPKVATTSVLCWMLRLRERCDESNKDMHAQRRACPGMALEKRDDWEHWLKCDDCFRFKFVRWPLARLVSGFLHKMMFHNMHDQSGTTLCDRLGVAKHDLTFRRFAQEVTSRKPHTLNPHWRPQCIIANVDLSYTGVLEELPEAFEIVQQRANTERKLPWFNKTAGEGEDDWKGCLADTPAGVAAAKGYAPDWRLFYDAELERLVTDYYARDIAIWKAAAKSEPPTLRKQ